MRYKLCSLLAFVFTMQLTIASPEVISSVECSGTHPISNKFIYVVLEQIQENQYRALFSELVSVGAGVDRSDDEEVPVELVNDSTEYQRIFKGNEPSGRSFEIIFTTIDLGVGKVVDAKYKTPGNYWGYEDSNLICENLQR